MSKFILIPLLFLGTISGLAQYTKIYSEQANYRWFGCDRNENVFKVKDNKLSRYPKPYSDSLTYDLQNDGMPDYIDISDPGEIVLYYQSMHKVKLLDSSLHEIITPFYLDELGLYNISIIFPSVRNSLWFYNYSSNSLTKLNCDFIPVVKSLSLDQYFELPHKPNFVTTFGDKIYLNVPSNGILVMGPDGEYVTALHLPGLIDFQVAGNTVYYYSDNIIYCFNYKTLETRKVYIPYEEDIVNAWYFDNRIILLKKNGFSVWEHHYASEQNQN
jgi:hypothetical protein